MREEWEAWQVKVTVACDYPIVRASVAEVLATDEDLDVDVSALEISGHSDARDVLLCITEARPDLESLLQGLRQSFGEAKLFCMFLANEDTSALAALRAGAVGIIDDTLRTPLQPQELIQRIKDVARGQFVMPAPMAVRLARLHSYPARHETASKDNCLTLREQEVLAFLARGASNREIAEGLTLSEHTVRAHLRGIMQKLHVSNRLQAAAFAWEGKFVPDLEGGTHGNSYR